MAVTNQLWKSALLLASLGSLPLLGGGTALAQSTFPPQPPACLTGYPDGSYRGDQPLTRDEFAAGMNACLPQQMTPRERLLLLQPERANLANREDFKALIERQRALNQQLRDLSDRVGNLADPQPKPATPE